MEFAHKKFRESGKILGRSGKYLKIVGKTRKSGKIVAKKINSSVCAASICRALWDLSRP
jgi:hypothetical protein